MDELAWRIKDEVKGNRITGKCKGSEGEVDTEPRRLSILTPNLLVNEKPIEQSINFPL